MSALRARTQLKFCLALLVPLVAACDARTLGDDVQVRIPDQGGPVEVDLSCPSCESTVLLDLSFDPQAYVADDAEVVIEQYRVDYDLDGVRAVPYFAGTLQQYVRATDGAAFSVEVVGSAQREHVLEASPDETVEGRATISLAGYDSDDEQVLLETDFAIRFVHQAAASEESAQ